MPVRVTNVSGYRLSVPQPFTDEFKPGQARDYDDIEYADALTYSNIDEMWKKGQIKLEDLSEYTGSVHGVPLSKYDGTAAPTVNDDEDAGYGPGSMWVDVTGEAGYLCVKATAGAAVWKQITV